LYILPYIEGSSFQVTKHHRLLEYGSITNLAQKIDKIRNTDLLSYLYCCFFSFHYTCKIVDVHTVHQTTFITPPRLSNSIISLISVAEPEPDLALDPQGSQSQIWCNRTARELKPDLMLEPHVSQSQIWCWKYKGPRARSGAGTANEPEPDLVLEPQHIVDHEAKTTTQIMFIQYH
jgi:hypothetical protein